jgi:hypothetical protein
MKIMLRQYFQLAINVVKRHDSTFAFVFLLLLAFALHKSALNGFWRFDDGVHLAFAAQYSPWEYFLHPSVMLLQSYANVTPYNALFYEINLAIFGMKPSWHYAHQIVILALIAFSTYRLLRLWQGPLTSSLAAVLFLGGLPTMQVAQQLMTGHYATGLLFTVLSLHSFYWGVSNKQILFVWIGAALYLLATTCKEVYVPLLLILPFIPVGNLRDRLRASLPYLGVAVLYSAWRYIVLGQFIGGYLVRSVDNWERILQIVSIPILMAGWQKGYNLADYLFDRNGLYAIAGLLVLILVALASHRRRLSWILIGVTLPLILLPLIPLTQNPEIREADRYLFLAWWVSSVFLAILIGCLKNSRFEYVFKFSCAVGLIAIIFHLQLIEHRRITPRLEMQDTLYKTVMRLDNDTALIPPHPRNDYMLVLAGAHQAASLLLAGINGTVKFAVDKSSLCEYTKQGNTILAFDETCNCMKDVTQQPYASLGKLLDRELGSIAGVPLSAKLVLNNRTMHWELGPYVDGVFSIIIGGTPNEVPAKGEIPWPRKELMQFKVRHVSLDGRVAVSPVLNFNPNEQKDFNWQGNSTKITLTCEPD